MIWKDIFITLIHIERIKKYRRAKLFYIFGEEECVVLHLFLKNLLYVIFGVIQISRNLRFITLAFDFVFFLILKVIEKTII
nr:hypothetical protein BCU58_24960 [Vibrio sp. 10N.286.48.B7]